MSERMTTIRIDGDDGWSNYGYLDRKTMIAAYRRQAKEKMAEAWAVLSAKDDDFVVEQHTGFHVRRNIKVLKP